MRGKRKSVRKDHWGYFFIAPFFIVLVIFNLYSIFYTFKLSFHTWDGISEPIWIGIQNYVRLLKDSIFWKSVIQTGVITVVAGGLQITTGLILAYILNQKFIKRANFFKNVFYFPNLVTAVSLGVLFSLLFGWQGGSINMLLEQLGIIKEPINWMVKGMFVQGLIIFITWFQFFGYYVIIFTAGIKGISSDLLEAAEIDGAGKWRTFISVVLPLLRPIITYSAINVLIGGMQLFDVPYVIGNGNGDPAGASLTAISYMYNTSFRNYNYGYGAAISYGLFLIVAVFSIIYMKMNMRKEGGGENE